MKLTFENDLKTCLLHLVVHQIVYKRHRIFPFFNYWMNPIRPVTSTLKTTVQQERSKYWITIHCRSLCMHDCLVAAFLVVRPAD